MSEEKETQKTKKLEYTILNVLLTGWKVIKPTIPEGGVKPFDWTHFYQLVDKGVVKFERDEEVKGRNPAWIFGIWSAKAEFPAKGYLHLGLHYALALMEKRISPAVYLGKGKLVVAASGNFSRGVGGTR